MTEEQSITERFRLELLRISDPHEMRVLDSNVLLVGFIISFAQGSITLISLNDRTYSEMWYGPLLLSFLVLTFFAFVPYRLAIKKKAIDLQVFVFRFLTLGLPLAFLMVIGEYILYLAGIYSSIGLLPRIWNPYLRSIFTYWILYLLLAGFVLFFHKKNVSSWGINVVNHDGEPKYSQTLRMMPAVESASVAFGFFMLLLIDVPLIGLPLTFDLDGAILTVSASHSLIGLSVLIGLPFVLLFWSVHRWTINWEAKIEEIMDFQRTTPNLVRANCPNCMKSYSYNITHIDKTSILVCQNCAKPFEPEIKTIMFAS